MANRSKKDLTGRLYQQVASSLRQRIMSGEYPLGKRMPAERLLAKEYNVSRPTIREAIIALEISGFVEVQVGSGVYVTSLEPNDRQISDLDIGPFELLEARQIIEGETAYLAADLISETDLLRLQRLLNEMENSNSNRADAEDADREFHITIARATQNSALVATVEFLWNVRETSPMLLAMAEKAHAKGIMPMLADHIAILEAIKSRDGDAARKAMNNHLGRVIDELLQATESEALEKARSETHALRSRFKRDRK